MALFQLCAVVGTLAVAAMAVALWRSMLTLQALAVDLGKSAESVRASAARIETVVTREAQQLSQSVQEVMPSVRRVVTRFERLGERTAQLSDTVLGEVEAPIRTAVAVMQGVRTGTNHLFRALQRRVARSQALTNGGHEHE